MAENVLKQLEEQLNCSVCLDTYTEPKLLQCFHVYCRQCLVKLVDRDQHGKLSLTCPTCRHVSPVPARGVAGLASAFHINRILDIKESLKKPENQAATPEKEIPTNVDLLKDKQCVVHEGKEMELFCETCGELVCWKCIAKGGNHHDHEYEELEQAFEKYKIEITPLLEPMERQVTATKMALAQLDARCEVISDQQAATVSNVHSTFARLREVLDVRETELIDQLDKATQSKLKSLAAQRDRIETTLAQLCSCLNFMRESFRTGKEGDVLRTKTNTVTKAKELTTPFKPGLLKPSKEADIELLASVDIIAQCRKYGQIYTPNLPDPSNCKLDANLMVPAVAGGKRSAILHAVNYKGKLCKGLIEALECNLVSEISGTRVSCRVERRGQSQYKISYQPAIKGQHQLHIEIQGQHIRGSPFNMAVKSPIEKLGTPIQTIGGVIAPWGVAINHGGEVVVAEHGGDCIAVFSPSGQKLRSFGACGSDPGQIRYPREVAVDGEENILLTDSGNHRIQKFTSEGQYSTSVGTRGSGYLQFSYPTGIAFNASNNSLYVGDTNNHRVQVLDSNLTTSRTFGKRGSGRGQFSSPCGVACDCTGDVYVADQDNHRVQVFTAEGRYLRMFGRRGQGRGELRYPVGVAIDNSGLVYVSDGDNHRILVFTSDGDFVTTFGAMGKGPGGFAYPKGLAVIKNGVVYVCDADNDRVQVF